MQYHISQISNKDLPLVKRFYKACGISVKYTPHEKIFVVRSRINETDLLSPILGAVRLQSCPQGYYLVRNLCVDPLWRKQGVARQLMTLALTHISGVACYCYAFTHLQNFYQSVGFVQLNPASDVGFNIPVDIVNGYEAYSVSRRNLILMCCGG